MRFSTKKVGLDDRLSLADTKAQSALNIFEQAADELDAAALEAREVKQEAETQVLDLTFVRDEAFRRQSYFSAKAESIREFLK